MKSLSRIDDIFSAFMIDEVLQDALFLSKNKRYHFTKSDDGQLTLEVPAPGLKKTNFNVNYANDVLSVSADVKKGMHTQSFSYRFAVGFVDPAKIEAIYEDGVLSVKLPDAKNANCTTITVK